MTDRQKFRFYFPAWNACVKANGWRKVKGRLVLEHSHQTEEMARVLIFGQQRAKMARRGLTVDDLRHGAHLLALGQDKSSEDLTNAEVDRVVTLFHLLTEPDNLTSRLAWDAYTRGEDPGAVKRVEYFIRRCPEAYVRAVSADKFGTRAWENLPIAAKKQLSMTLKNRRPKAPRPARRVTQPQEQLDPANAPY